MRIIEMKKKWDQYEQFNNSECGDKVYVQQECIPVGCVPAAHWPYAGVCFPGGVSAPRGLLWGCVCSGGVSALGGCLLWGVSALGGLCSGGCLLWGGVLGGVCSGGVCSGGCLLWGGVWSGGCLPRWGCLLWGVSGPRGWYPSMHWGRHLPCEQNDRQVQKYYLGHNFVVAGKYLTRKLIETHCCSNLTTAELKSWYFLQLSWLTGQI